MIRSNDTFRHNPIFTPEKPQIRQRLHPTNSTSIQKDKIINTRLNPNINNTFDFKQNSKVDKTKTRLNPNHTSNVFDDGPKSTQPIRSSSTFKSRQIGQSQYDNNCRDYEVEKQMRSSACYSFKPDSQVAVQNKKTKNKFLYNSDQLDLDYLRSKKQQKEDISNKLSTNQKKRRLYENYYVNNIVGYEKQPVSKLNSTKNTDHQKLNHQNKNNTGSTKRNNSLTKKLINQESHLNEDFKGPSRRYSQVKKHDWMDNQNDDFRKSNQNFSDLMHKKPKEYEKKQVKVRTVVNTGNESWISVTSKTHVNNDFKTLQKPFVKRQQEMGSNMDNHSFKYSDRKQKIFDYDDRRVAHSACKKQSQLTHKGF